MTREQALNWYDTQADSLQRAGVKIRMFHAMQERNADLWKSDDAGKQAIIAAEMIKAIASEMKGDKLP